MKKLLVFAHRGEAQAFLEHFPFAAYEFKLGNIYSFDETFLMICGEGEKSGLMLSAFLGHINQPLSLYNFGIAGALDQKLTLGEIYPIKTIYGYQDKPQFHTFKLAGKVDVLTTSERILKEEHLKFITPIAPLVDREAHHLAEVAQMFKLDFHCFKLVSDYAGKNTQCLDIKNLAAEYSKKFLDYYLKLDLKTEKEITSAPKLPADFHFSFTQQKEFEKFLGILCHKYCAKPEEILEKAEMGMIQTLKILPKDRSRLLIQNMRTLVNPMFGTIQKKLNDLTAPLSEIGAQVHFDSELEVEEFKLSMTVNSDKNLTNLSSALKHISFEKIKDVFAGKFDV